MKPTASFSCFLTQRRWLSSTGNMEKKQQREHGENMQIYVQTQVTQSPDQTQNPGAVRQQH